jgi:CubicO group peptidase (beta-lactamase class C family)
VTAVVLALLVQAWESRPPEEAGLSRDKLDALRDHVGGRGCVVRHGLLAYTWGDVTKSSDVASAFKPVLSTLLLMAVQEGKLKGVDDPVAEFEPRLAGKDATMTWRHLASQTSGYGLEERPGEAYSYNDYALALYYDTLMQKVFKEAGTEVLRSRLGEALGFEDKYTFEAFGPKDRPGRLAMSVRDFARFGLLILRGGRWGGRPLVRPDLLAMSLASPIAAATPVTSGRNADMLPGQRTIGGTRTITKVGPGCYSFNWWLNRTDDRGRRLWMDGAPDAIVASGHGGQRTLWIVPSLDLVVAWNDSPIDDHDKSPGNRESRNNVAARLLREAVLDAPRTVLGTAGPAFTLSGEPTFLLGLSAYAALGAPEDAMQRDLEEAKRRGFNWIRVWATWAAFGNDVSAVDPADGRAREPGLSRLKRLVESCDRLGFAVDVTLSRGNGRTGPPRLQSAESHRRAVETLVVALRPYRNWYLDLSNERNIKDKRYTSIDELRNLRERVRLLDPWRLVTASHAGDISKEELREYLSVPVDFVTPHRPRNAGSAAQTEGKAREMREWMKEFGRNIPLHFQEPFRRGFEKWSPVCGNFEKDLAGARAGGAAGWCFHNGNEDGPPDGRPRRSFDLRDKGLFEQLDEEEVKFLRTLEKK